MQNKLQELTDKLYNEGLSKGKQEGEELLAKAKVQAEEIVAFNKMLKEYAKSADIPYVDYHSKMKNSSNGLPKEYAEDGCHPTKAGYDVMKKIILKYL